MPGSEAIPAVNLKEGLGASRLHMVDLDGKDLVMKDDYRHWQQCSLMDGGFTAYVGQEWAEVHYDDGLRQEWIKRMIADHKAGRRPSAPPRKVAQGQAPAGV